MDIKLAALTLQEVDRFQFPADYSSAKRLFIGPQATIDLDGPQFDDRDIERRFSAQNKKRLFIWGWMEYGDILQSRQRHRTEFCMELNADVIVDLEKGTSRNVPRFVMHSRHNGADSECMHKPLPCRSN